MACLRTPAIRFPGAATSAAGHVNMAGHVNQPADSMRMFPGARQGLLKALLCAAIGAAALPGLPLHAQPAPGPGAPADEQPVPLAPGSWVPHVRSSAHLELGDGDRHSLIVLRREGDVIQAPQAGEVIYRGAFDWTWGDGIVLRHAPNLYSIVTVGTGRLQAFDPSVTRVGMRVAKGAVLGSVSQGLGHLEWTLVHHGPADAPAGGAAPGAAPPDLPAELTATDFADRQAVAMRGLQSGTRLDVTDLIGFGRLDITVPRLNFKPEAWSFVLPGGPVRNGPLGPASVLLAPGEYRLQVTERGFLGIPSTGAGTVAIMSGMVSEATIGTKPGSLTVTLRRPALTGVHEVAGLMDAATRRTAVAEPARPATELAAATPDRRGEPAVAAPASASPPPDAAVRLAQSGQAREPDPQALRQEQARAREERERLEREQLAAARVREERDRLAAEARQKEEQVRLAQAEQARERERLLAEARAQEQRERLEREQLAAARAREERDRLAAEARQKEEQIRLAQAELARERQRQRELEEARAQAQQERERLAAELARVRAEMGRARPEANPAVAHRKALVIGNDAYRHVAPLKAAREDARAIAEALRQVGYAVTVRLDLGEREMRAAIRSFVAQVQGGDEVTFFFAGHGVQIGGSNYLIPVDIEGEGETQIRDEAVALQRVLDDIAERKAKFTLAVIDACRDNPFKVAGRTIGGAARGLAPTTAATGQMVIFSAGAGQRALDTLGASDTSRNGVFTRVFTREMLRPSVSIDKIARDTRTEVVRLARSVGHEQVLAIYDQVVGEFFFLR